jgi:phospholipid/cholesterol/gamma-HCH transport system substrate-binding protein
MRQVIAEVKAGKGPLGTILKDTVMARELKHTVSQLENVALHAEKLAGELQTITVQVGNEIRDGKGPVNLALKDTAVAGNISRSLNNVEKGTYNFNQNMEALKQNFLFRGYFKKQEKARQKAASAQ